MKSGSLGIPDRCDGIRVQTEVRIINLEVIAMKNFKEKWFINASIGLFGRVVFYIFLLGGGIVGSVYLLPKENTIIKTITGTLPFVIGVCLAHLPSFLNSLKEWAQDARNDRIKELELKNENLKLELELKQQEYQSQSDNDE